MKNRIRPKTDYLFNISLKELHTMNRAWESELEFMIDELHFLKHVLEKLIMTSEQEAFVERGNDLIIKVINLEIEGLPPILRKIEHHEEHLSAIIDNPFEEDEQGIREEHGLTEEKLVSLQEEFRTLKQNVFDLVKMAG